MRLARRPGVWLFPAALTARPPLPPLGHLRAAPPEARTCGGVRREPFFSPPFPTNNRAPLARRSRRTEQTFIDFHRRAAEERGAPGERAAAGSRAVPRSRPRNSGGEGGTNRGGTRSQSQMGGCAHIRGAACKGRRSSAKGCAGGSGLTPGRAEGPRGERRPREMRSVPSRDAGPPSCRSRRVTSLMATTTRLSRKVVSPVPPLPSLSTATGVSD